MNAPDLISRPTLRSVPAEMLDALRARFGERLAVEIHVEPALAALQVPNFLLQPLVENAVRHGAAARLASNGIPSLATAPPMSAMEGTLTSRGAQITQLASSTGTATSIARLTMVRRCGRGRLGRSSAARTSARGYSTVLVNTMGAISVLKIPPIRPANEIQR